MISIFYLVFSGFKFIIKKNVILFIIIVLFYGFDDYINDLYILDFETLLFNINYKNNILDN